jgi:hypothetical protein
MDEREVGRAAFAQDASVGLAEELAAAPGSRSERLPWLQTGRYE